MEKLLYLPDFILHFDKHLSQAIQEYSGWVYLFLFLIIFIETGVVAMPFLPGDSLLFTVGAFAAIGSLEVRLAVFILVCAAVLGDTANYAIGRIAGPKIFYKEQSIFFKREYLERTRRFYEKYGSKTIVLARFVPVIRTFAPFVAGIGRMKYGLFLLYNALGGILWVTLCIFSGYFLGNIPIVKNNFSLVILVIIFLSVLPIFWEIWKHRREQKHPGLAQGQK